MSENLQQSLFECGQDENVQRYYPQVFRANHTAYLESVKLLVMSVICGPKSFESYAKLNQDGLWEKMCQGCSQAKMDGFLDEFLGTWPWGGIVWDGYVYPLTPLVPHFGVSVSQLWPRPIASDGIAWTKNKKSNPRGTIVASWKRGAQDRSIYGYMWHGLSATQAADLNETMMGFPLHWTDLDA